MENQGEMSVVTMLPNKNNNDIQSSFSDKPDLSCHICNIVCTNTESYKEHVDSEEHLNMAQHSLVSSILGDNAPSSDSQKDDDNKSEKLNKDDHNLNIDLPMKMEISQNTINTQNLSGNNYYHCGICDIVCTGFEPYSLHMNSKKHMKKKIQHHNMIVPSKRNVSLESNTEEKLNDPNLYLKNLESESSDASTEGCKILATKELHHNSVDKQFDEFRCNICNIICTGPEPYDQHLSSKKHLKKELQNPVVSSSSNKTNEEPMNINNVECDVSSQHDVKFSFNTLASKSNYFNCNICDIVCCGIEPYNQHLSSKKHLKKVFLFEYITSKRNSTNITSECSSSEQETSKLVTPEELMQVQNDTESLEAEVPKSKYDLHDIPISTYLRCDTCGITCTGMEPYNQHLESKKHVKKMSEQANIGSHSEKITYPECNDVIDKSQYSNHIESNKIVKLNDSHFPYACEACDMRFSGKIPYDMHLVSDKHKRKARNLNSVMDTNCKIGSNVTDSEKCSLEAMKPSGLTGIDVCSVNDLNITIFHPNEEVDFNNILPRNDPI